MDKLNTKGFCLVCSTNTSLVCHRCGDFYCSRECQLKDWQRHRYICFSLPPLVYPRYSSVFQEADAAVVSTNEELQKTKVNGTQKPASNKETNGTALAPVPVPVPNPVAVPVSARVAVTVQKTNASSVEFDKKINTNCNSNQTQQKTDSTTTTNNSKKIVAPAAIVDVPAAISNCDLTNACPPCTRLPPSNSIVYITGFMSPNRCFLRDASESAEKAYFDLCKKVNLVAKTLPRKERIKALEYALVNHNGCFQRVKAIWNKYGLPRLMLLDSGSFISSKKAEMREINRELFELPRCSFQVQLKDVPNYVMSDEIMKFVRQFEGYKFVLTYKGNEPVELRNPNTQMQLKEQILKFCRNMDIFGQPTQSKKTEANESSSEKSSSTMEKPAAQNMNEVNTKLSQSPDITSDASNNKEEESISSENEKTNKKPTVAASMNEGNMKLSETLELTSNNSSGTEESVLLDKCLINLSYDGESTNEMPLGRDAKLLLNIHKDQLPKPDYDAKEIKLDLNSISIEKPKANVNEINEAIEIQKECDDKLVSQLPTSSVVENLKIYSPNIACRPKIYDFPTILFDDDENDGGKKDAIISTVKTKVNEKVKNTQQVELSSEELKILKESQENCIIKSAVSSTPEKPRKTNHLNDLNVPLLIPPFEIGRLVTSNKEGLDAIIVDNANVSRGIIGAFDSIHSGSISKLYFHLSQIIDTLPYRPCVKEYVIAKYEKSWSRAKVMEIKQDLYTVMFLDYSNVSTVVELDIRRYPAELTIPCHTSICLIEGFPHRPTKRQIEYLEKTLHMNSRLHIDSVSYLQEMALIRCNSLLEELKKYQ